jgi:hypothetical protein
MKRIFSANKASDTQGHRSIDKYALFDGFFRQLFFLFGKALKAA